MRIKLYEDFKDNKITRYVLIDEIDSLLVELIDDGFEWFFVNFHPKFRDIDDKKNTTVFDSLYKKNDTENIEISINKENEDEFKIDDNIIDHINTLVDWMYEKYGITKSSYELSLITNGHRPIITEDFGEDELGLVVSEITIRLFL